MHRAGVLLFVPFWRGGHIGQGARSGSLLVLRSGGSGKTMTGKNKMSKHVQVRVLEREKSSSQGKTAEDNASTKYLGL